MSPFRILVGGLMLVAVVLAVLNPGPDKFKAFLQDTLADRAADRVADATGNIGGGVADFLADRIGREVGGLASQAFERDNYYVWSVYRVDLNGRQADGEVEFLGIANSFIPLKLPQALRDL